MPSVCHAPLQPSKALRKASLATLFSRGLAYQIRKYGGHKTAQSHSQPCLQETVDWGEFLPRAPVQTIGTNRQGTHTSLRLGQVPPTSLWPSFQSQWPQQVEQSLVPPHLCCTTLSRPGPDSSQLQSLILQSWPQICLVDLCVVEWILSLSHVLGASTAPSLPGHHILLTPPIGPSRHIPGPDPGTFARILYI